MNGRKSIEEGIMFQWIHIFLMQEYKNGEN